MQALRFTRCIFCRTCDIPKNDACGRSFEDQMAVPYGNGCAGRHHRRRANEDGIAQFVSTAGYFAKENEITILFTAVADKHYHEMIGEICEGIHPSHVVATQIDGSRVVPAEVLAEDFRKSRMHGCLRGTGDRSSV